MQHVTLSTKQCKQCGRYMFASETTCPCRAIARRDRSIRIAEYAFGVAWLAVIIGWHAWEVMK